MGEDLPYIRPGRDADAGGYIALIGACWGEYPGVVVDVAAEVPEVRALATHMASRGGALWTAEQQGAVVGMVATYPAAQGWALSRMYLDVRLRGSGLGRSLLQRAEDHARQAGAARMTLWSDVLFTRAHAFYEKHGYVRRGGLRALHDLSNTIEAGFAKPLAGIVVERLDVAAAESAERALATILQACVGGAAMLPFHPPLAREPAQVYWRGVTKAVGAGGTVLLAAWQDGALAGAAQLDLDMAQPCAHRARLRALLVDPARRRIGVGYAILQAAEQAAAAAGRRLLMLDTQAGGAAQRLCGRHAWQVAGTLPGGVLDADGRAHDVAMLFKAL